MCSPGMYVTALSISHHLHASGKPWAPLKTEFNRPRARRGGHGPREGPVELAAEAPVNGETGSQHLLQLNLLTLLLLHGHISKT